MKIIVYTISGALVIFGSLAIALGPSLSGYAEFGLKRTVTGFMVLGWGLTFGYLQAKSYQGGITTVIGVLLLGVGIWNGVGDLLWKTFTTLKDAIAYIFASLFLIGAGGALLWQGHRVHKMKTTNRAKRYVSQ